MWILISRIGFVLGISFMVASVNAQQSMAGNAGGGMAHMAGHMYMTAPRSPSPADQKKADAVAAAAKTAMAPFLDYHKALAAGYKIFLADIPQPQYHFTNYEYGAEARRHFAPLKPTLAAL